MVEGPAVKASLGSIEVAIGGIIVIGVLAYIYYQRKAIGAAVNPLSSHNLASTAVDRTVQAVTGGAQTSLGGWIANSTQGTGTTYRYSKSQHKIVTIQGQPWYENLLP